MSWFETCHIKVMKKVHLQKVTKVKCQAKVKI